MCKAKKLILSDGRIALIDARDYQRVSRLKWHAKSGQYPYVKATTVEHIYLHRLILNAPDGSIVDHIDKNPLNNQRNNLRLCTRSQNAANSRKAKSTSSKFRGVSYYALSGKWRAQISVNRRQRHLGLFDTEEEAAHRYDVEARLIFGRFATLNFPPKPRNRK